MPKTAMVKGHEYSAWVRSVRSSQVRESRNNGKGTQLLCAKTKIGKGGTPQMKPTMGILENISKNSKQNEFLMKEQ